MGKQVLTKPPTTQSSHVLFESLQAQKRRDDPASVARRQSFNEQRPQGGFLGQMWNKYAILTSPSLTFPFYFLKESTY